MQAVILAGGRGERLRPLTDTIPKPMVEIDGKPFIYHLVLQLKAFGISNVLILAGYRSEILDDYFQSFSDNTLHITVVKADDTLSKSERITAAQELIQSYFILLYSDNYAQFDLSRIINHPAPNVLTVCRKNPGNIMIDSETMEVQQFLHGGRERSASHVEIGYSKFTKSSLINEIKKTNNLDIAISNLSTAGELFAIELSNSYLSISDPVRLELTKKHFENKNIILIDRDGVINQKPEKATYLSNENEIRYIPETLEFMAIAAKKFSKKFIVISNQAGIGRGMVTQDQVDKVNLKIKSDLEKISIEILDFLYCPHGWNDGCDCRKPNPGLLFQASEKFGFILRNTYFIGDDIRDAEAAIKSGTRAILIDPELCHSRIPNVVSVENLNIEVIKLVCEAEL